MLYSPPLIKNFQSWYWATNPPHGKAQCSFNGDSALTDQNYPYKDQIGYNPLRINSKAYLLVLRTN